MGTDGRERVYMKDRAAWRAWLVDHADRTDGIWLEYDKAPARTLPYDDIVEEALCFGWVDSRPGKLSDTRSLLYVAPRKPTSRWSRANRERVERLRKAGAMTERGEAAVRAAVAAGVWDALDEVEELREPDDLCAALDAVPAARREWDAFPPSVRRAILEWLLSAKRPETRARRLDTIVADAAVGRRANQWRQPKSR
ncbi:MAG: YdeI/OmpD-associated family protein [Acidimicrobiia bacterium]